MNSDSKFEHFSRQLERIGVERKKNLDEKWADIYDCRPISGFRHRDFTVQFRNSTELEKSLGRKAKNRLMQLAGLVGYFGSFCRNYTESKKINVGDSIRVPSVKITDTTFEDALNNKEPDHPATQPLPNTPIVVTFANRIDFEDRPSIVPVPQTSKALLGIYRNREAIKHALQFAKECGLIQVVVDSYAYGRKGHVAKKYAWNKVCERQLRELMKKYGILIPSISRDSELPPFEKPEASEDVSQLYYKVRLGKGMRTPGMTEPKVSRILSYKHRNVLEPFLDRLAFVNEGRTEAEKLNFRFSVKITNGYNVKNGCRTYSLAGGLVKESKKTDEGEESFEEYFRRTRGDEPVEYDVKGSVPRINRLVNFGVWDDWNEDPYSEMFKGFCSDGDRRKIAKSMYMLYEFEQSGLKIKSSVARKCPEFVKAEGEEEIRQTMEYWYEGVWKWQGDSIGSLAFLYEDAAYTVVDKALKELGYDFIRKFDCWVFPEKHRPDEREFWKLVKECVMAWRRSEYEDERKELEFLEEAGIREMKKHVFQAKGNRAMNETEDVLNDKSDTTPTSESLPNTPIVVTFANRIDFQDRPSIVTKVESGSVFMDKLPKSEIKAHWAKTTLEVRGKRENLMVLESGKLGTLLIKWQNKDALTKSNLVKIIKAAPACLWRVKWLESDDGTRFAVKILDETQYAAESADRNRHRKMMKHGFATQNGWLS